MGSAVSGKFQNFSGYEDMPDLDSKGPAPSQAVQASAPAQPGLLSWFFH